jgi:hypothetical protein
MRVDDGSEIQKGKTVYIKVKISLYSRIKEVDLLTQESRLL